MTKNELQRLAKVESRLYQLAEEAGLKFHEIEWDIIPDQKMFEIMAYRIPGNISNWKYGRDYERIRTINEQYMDGLPYEVVINSDPSRAYLMKSNTFGVQCLVMAHVIGHVSFFTMNKYFANTRKDMIQVLDTAAKRFNEYEKNYGIYDVEKTIDAAHAIQFHSSPFDKETEEVKKKRVFEMLKRRNQGSKSDYHDILDTLLNDEVPKQDINLFNQRLWRRIKDKTPVEPAADLLRYIIDYSTILEDWQRDICEILRLEGQYFWPQMKTKYMNEGWATYWHQTLMKQLFDEGTLNTEEFDQYNHSNSLVKASNPKSMNPYLVGCEIWEDIEERWNKGRHGDDYEDCQFRTEKENWDTKDGKGREKMFEIMKSETDWFFVMQYLTTEMIDKLNLYVYVLQETPESYDLVRTNHTAKQVRDLIVQSFAHSHIPNIEIIDINHEDAGKFLIKHQHVGADLDMKYTEETLKHIKYLWGREVVLDTKLNKKPVRLKCDKEDKITKLDLSVEAKIAEAEKS